MIPRVEAAAAWVVIVHGLRVQITPEQALELSTRIVDAVRELHAAHHAQPRLDDAVIPAVGADAAETVAGGVVLVEVSPITLRLPIDEARGFAAELARCADEVLTALER